MSEEELEIIKMRNALPKLYVDLMLDRKTVTAEVHVEGGKIFVTRGNDRLGFALPEGLNREHNR